MAAFIGIIRDACRLVRHRRAVPFVAVLALGLTPKAMQGQAVHRGREFKPGTISKTEDLPPGRVRSKIERLPAGPRTRALQHLKSFHFTEMDLDSLAVDEEGALLYIDHFNGEPAGAAEEENFVASAAAVPVTPFPGSLVFHSRPGSANVLYLNFSGETVQNTAWNSSIGRSVISAVAFSTDDDYSTFSDAEQTSIRRIWQRVSEDYVPFDIDVTTERPASFGNRTAHALITRTTDATGAANPSADAGGVAYVDSFATSGYARYRPAWIYVDNLSSTESFVAEAASHEIGHNMGLSHDGTTSGREYYSGHGSGETSWAPIMGSGYNRNVTQWSKGEYYLANNTQDDLAVIAAKVAYRPDDHGNSPSSATALVFVDGTNVISTTPETDLTNSNRNNKGVLERTDDVDVFRFSAGNGLARLAVKPWISPSGLRAGNVDVAIELRNIDGTLIASDNSASTTAAQVQATLTSGTYYLYVRNSGTGSPEVSSPSGYTAYGSVGQYFISGSVAPTLASSLPIQLITSVNNPEWGSVAPSSGSYLPGTLVRLTATPAPYFKFVSWTNGGTGTNAALDLTLLTDLNIGAVFAEIVTTNHPTPYWWLAAQGYKANFESAVEAIGANGLPLWQSYEAGLDPKDSSSQLRLAARLSSTGDSLILTWITQVGRVYTVKWSPNIAGPFTPVGGGTDLPSSVTQLAIPFGSSGAQGFFRIEAKTL